jgi:hypothetical protein
LPKITEQTYLIKSCKNTGNYRQKQQKNTCFVEKFYYLRVDKRKQNGYNDQAMEESGEKGGGKDDRAVW